MYFRRMPALPEVGFQMGEYRVDSSAEPRHTVLIEAEFLMGTFPVTQQQYRAVAVHWADRRLDPDPSHFKGDLRPVERVRWHDAVAWCACVQERWRELRCVDRAGSTVPIKEFGLPTEAHWEYACRAGTTTEYHAGNGAARLARAGWFNRNADGKTHPVGERDPNAWGLHDMHGNVWEWCRDVWDGHAYRKREDGWVARAWERADAGDDAEFWKEASRNKQDPIRVIRGGSWFNTAGLCRSAIRDWWRPVNRYWTLGFRCCLFPGPVAQANKFGHAQAEPTAGAERRGTRSEADAGGGAGANVRARGAPARSGREARRAP